MRLTKRGREEGESEGGKRDPTRRRRRSAQTCTDTNTDKAKAKKKTARSALVGRGQENQMIAVGTARRRKVGGGVESEPGEENKKKQTNKGK